MNGRFLLLLLVAFIFAGLAALIAKSWINSKVNKDVSTSAVVIAATEIPFGVKLEKVHLKTVNWPGGDVPPGTYKNVDDVVGKIVKNSFYPGELITEKRVAEHLGGSTLSSLVSENSRAISIRVDDVVGVSGFVLPGNRVDVLATKVNRTGGEAKATTRTILGNIKVLAVDQEASPDKEKPALVKSVTLELNPEQAEKMVAAMQEGTIQLTLRNPLDANVIIQEQKPEPLPPPVVRAALPKRAKAQPTMRIVPW